MATDNVYEFTNNFEELDDIIRQKKVFINSIDELQYNSLRDDLVVIFDFIKLEELIYITYLDYKKFKYILKANDSRYKNYLESDYIQLLFTVCEDLWANEMKSFSSSPRNFIGMIGGDFDKNYVITSLLTKNAFILLNRINKHVTLNHKILRGFKLKENYEILNFNFEFSKLILKEIENHKI